jgi:hypothetical protein
MKYWLGFPICLIIGVLSFIHPSGIFFITVSGKLPILLSVIMAAIFVRLARGFPAIPYEKIDPSKSFIATQAFRKLVRSYIITLTVIFVSIMLNIFASTIDIKTFDEKLLSVFSGILALSNSFVILSLISLISSDVIISFIQADLIDEVTGSTSTTSVVQTQSKVRDEFNVKDGRDAKITQL